MSVIGKPCIRCGSTDRETIGRCHPCALARSAVWYSKNKDRKFSTNQKWIAENLDAYLSGKRVSNNNSATKLKLDHLEAIIREVQENSTMGNDSLKKLTTAKIWEEFRAALSRTEEGIQRMAECYVELESRGENMGAYRNSMLEFLPDVARGKILPGALLRYGNSPSIMGAISKLIPEDQKKLSGADARVAVLQTDGRTRNARIAELNQGQLAQVLGDGRIRTVAEQQRHLAPAPKPRVTRHVAPLNSFWDLFSTMTQEQRTRINALCEQKDMTAAEFLIDLAVRHRILPGVPKQAKGKAA